MLLSGLTITLLLTIGLMSVVFVRRNPVAYESPDYLAEVEELNANDYCTNMYHK